MSRPAKRRRVSEDVNDGPTRQAVQDESIRTAYAQNASKWDLEQSYERLPRKNKKGQDVGRLPLRTETGWVEQERSPVSEEQPEDEWFDSEDERDIMSPEAGPGLGNEEVPAVPWKQQLREAKEELARCALLINEDPDEHIGALKTIARIAESPNATIKMLALATQHAVYKDIIPGYRIRPHLDNDSGVKLSKEVRRLRNFEQSLVGGYQQYIATLAQCAQHRDRATTDDEANLASLAISCACSLLKTVPHFNFRGELLKILVATVSKKRFGIDYQYCIETLETLFSTDEDGNASMDAVAMLTKMIKARNYMVDEAVLNTFLHLRLLSEFSQKGSHTGVDKANNEEEPLGKRSKEKRTFRTKKQRKLLREQKGLAKEMNEADAAVSHEERDKMQAESLKLVFVTYFRILKTRTTSLTGAVLEGLARYAHLINQDFFGDILEALRDLVSQFEASDAIDSGQEQEGDSIRKDEASARSSREALLCIITAFALLQGQEPGSAMSSLNLDLNFFTTHLYKGLLTACLDPDIEVSVQPSKSTVADESSSASKNRVNIQTTTVLLLRSINSALLPSQNLRSIPPTRIAAFTKNLMTASLQLPEKSCLAMLQLLQKVMKVHGRKIAALWHTEERKGDGTFEPLKAEGGGEGSNPFAATVWEGELLRRHFCPGVKDAAKVLEKAVIKSRV